MAMDGLITLRSARGPEDTMNRCEAEVRAMGMKVFAHIDHAAVAAAAGLPLRPTDLLIFGNIRSDLPLLQAVQTIAIDLPLKILVWQDASGATWLSYNDPTWLVRRHTVDSGADPSLHAMAAALATVVASATTSP
jgi:uncharacterized protein (DUF302 family)